MLLDRTLRVSLVNDHGSSTLEREVAGAKLHVHVHIFSNNPRGQRGLDDNAPPPTAPQATLW